jgi:hypothetical protein
MVAGRCMPLVYLPDVENFFSWGEQAPATEGVKHVAALVTPAGVEQVEGTKLDLVEAAARLAAMSGESLGEVAPSVAIWALASKLGLELVARERVVPKLGRRHGKMEARWAAALSAVGDAERVAAIARSMPPAAHAVPISAESQTREVWAAEALLRAFLDALADALVRSSQGAPVPGKGRQRAGAGEGSA